MKEITPMILSASALLLTALSAPVPTGITPLSLAVRPHVVERVDAPYNWTLQQGGGATGLQLADSTATCDTGPICSGKYCVPDCRFD